MLSPNFPKWNIHILHDCRGLHGKCMEMLIVLLQKKKTNHHLYPLLQGHWLVHVQLLETATCGCSEREKLGKILMSGKRCTILIYPGQSEEPRTGHFQIAHHSMVKVIVEWCSQGVQLSGNRSFTRPHIPNWWWIKTRVSYSSKSSQLYMICASSPLWFHWNPR